MQPRDKDPRFAFAVNRILDALRRRGATSDYCQRCGANDWNVDVVRVSAVPMPIVFGLAPAPPPSQAYIPSLCIVCKNCGNMILHNLQSLTKDDPLFLRSLGFKE